MRKLTQAEEDGFIVAHCPALKGCVTQGKTEGEALSRIREAVELYLADDSEASEFRPDHRVAQIGLKPPHRNPG